MYIKVVRDIVSILEGSPLPHTHPQRRDSGFMVKGLYSWKIYKINPRCAVCNVRCVILR